MTFIKPIEFNGHVQRTNDVSQLKHHEDNKALQDQNNGQQTVQKNLEHTMREVADKNNADHSERGFDAKEKGSNEYSRQEQKRKEKKPKDKVIKKSQQGFDIKI